MRSSEITLVCAIGLTVTGIIAVMYSMRPGAADKKDPQVKLVKEIDDIEGVFSTGVLKDVRYEVVGVSEYKLSVSLQRYGEVTTVYYDLPNNWGNGGWCSLNGKLSPEVEQTLESRFRPDLDKLIELDKQRDAFRALIYDYEKE